ncbi:MAG: hypothetical protein IPP83_13600 [Flavobacteriales bacterium]|nr:hypothetical protein [Flavobacteriales bacterium]
MTETNIVQWPNHAHPPKPLRSGYLLRVEKMDRKKWWWQVYSPDRKEVIDSPWMMNTMEDAFTIAETVYEVHRRASR